jgi:hypothetical protein
LACADRFSDGNQATRFAETARRHVSVDRLVLTIADQVRAPHIEVRIVLVFGEGLEMFERSPILHVGETAFDLCCPAALLDVSHCVVLLFRKALQCQSCRRF